MFVCCECCVVSGRGLCDELITHPEEYYWLWCVVVCDPETSRIRGHGPLGGCFAKKKSLLGLKLYSFLFRFSHLWMYNLCMTILYIIIIINIKDWTLWPVPSPKLQLVSPTFLRSSSCSPSLWSVVVLLHIFLYYILAYIQHNGDVSIENSKGVRALVFKICVLFTLKHSVQTKNLSPGRSEDDGLVNWYNPKCNLWKITSVPPSS